MSSGIRTFNDEYKGEPETHRPGSMHITQVGVGNGEVGISFMVHAYNNILNEYQYAGLTLNKNQLKVLVADIIDHLSSNIQGDIYDEIPLTEELAKVINTTRLHNTSRR